MACLQTSPYGTQMGSKNFHVESKHLHTEPGCTPNHLRMSPNISPENQMDEDTKQPSAMHYNVADSINSHCSMQQLLVQTNTSFSIIFCLIPSNLVII